MVIKFEYESDRFNFLGNKNKKAGSKIGDTQPAPIIADKDELRDIRKKTEKG